jgi:hypothetical protein
MLWHVFLGMAALAQPASGQPAPLPAATQQGPAPLALPEGKKVEIEFLATLSSATSHAGDMFPIRLAAPIEAGGQVVVPAGVLGLGEVIEAKPAGGSGKPGVLILAARYIDYNGHQIPLSALAQSPVGRDRVREANKGMTGYSAASLAGGTMAVAVAVPMTMLGMATSGGDTMVPKGGIAQARIGPAEDTALARPRKVRPAPLGPVEPLPENAALSVPAPPAGLGQVVFYRPGSLSWAAIGCTVKEGDHKVSSLGSGKWFAVLVQPGVHAFRVTGETSDALRLNVEPGETQFVSCRMRASVLIARPFIRPEDTREFHHDLPDLRPVADADMAGEGVLRRMDLRLALAERGDVRTELRTANRAVEQNGVLESADEQTKSLIRQGVRKVARDAAREAVRGR